MKRVIYIICLLFIVSASGCASPLSMTNWKGQRIFVGQSNDSVERLLGPPDRAGRPFQQIGQLAAPGMYTIEWIYWGQPESLRLWFDFGELRVIWLTDTNEIR